MDEALDIHILNENFIEDFDSLRFEEKDENEIFLKLIKADNIESVSTKVLAYIFDTHKNHGLGNLPLKALFTLLGINSSVPKFSTTKEEVSCFYGGKSKKNGRMDLLIEAPPYLFVIENKIRHKLDNPLDEYRKWVEKNYAQNDNFTEKYYIVLGINKPKENLRNFKFISHHDLVTKILEYKSRLALSEKMHMTPFIEDYFRAMTNMNTVLSNEENQILEFCIKNAGKLDQLQTFKEKVASFFESNLINITQEIDVFNDCKVDKDIAHNWQDLSVYIDSNYFFAKNWALKLQVRCELENIRVYLTPYSKIHKKVLSRADFENFLTHLKSSKVTFFEHKPIDGEFYIELVEFNSMEQNLKIIKGINEFIAKIQ